MEPALPTRRQLLAQSAARAVAAPEPVAFNPDEFAGVNVTGLQWLLDPRLARMLDIMAASPGAVRTVRAPGVLSLGAGAGVWDGPGPPAFGRTLDALAALTSRGLVPFLPLGYFPPRVSPMPTAPPPGWDAWATLVRAFLDAAVARFGAPEVGRWWFEAWTEPNNPAHWSGDFDQYLALYRATADAVAQSGHAIRLGGPAVAYLPGEGQPLMERFLRLLADTPGLRCDFLSYSRHGSSTPDEGEPDLRRLLQAATDTAEALLRIAPGRARGMVVVNTDADMVADPNRAYPPRGTQAGAAWLAAASAGHDRLNGTYAAQGIRFRAISGGASQHLAEGPFDGRATLMTPIGARMDDLAKLPAYGVYEMLRLMGRRRIADPAAARAVPAGVLHLPTDGPAGATVLFTQVGGEERRFAYPLSGAMPGRDGLMNVVQLAIDASRTGARPGPDALAMRRGAELAAAAPIRHQVRASSEPVVLGASGTVLLWVSPFRPAPLPVPEWLQARPDGPNTLLRWTHAGVPHFWSYEVRRDGAVITPVPLRAAFWVDDGAGYPAGTRRRYEVRSISVSGNASSWATAIVNL